MLKYFKDSINLFFKYWGKVNLKMEKYSFLANARPDEVSFYQKLIDTATLSNTKKIEGMYAVDFFK